MLNKAGGGWVSWPVGDVDRGGDRIQYLGWILPLAQSAQIQAVGICASDFADADMKSPMSVAGAYSGMRGKYCLTPR